VAEDTKNKATAQMGNLGLYQVMTSVAKKVGGPLVLPVAGADRRER
jgi:hypothetical protein